MDWGLKKIIKIYGLISYHFYFFTFLKFLLLKGNFINSSYLLNSLFLKLKLKFKINIHFIFAKVFFTLKPLIYVFSKKIRYITYTFGIKIFNEKKRVNFTIKWLIKSFRDKKNTRGLSLKDLNIMIYDNFYYKGLCLETKFSYYSKVLDSLPFIRKLRYKKIKYK